MTIRISLLSLLLVSCLNSFAAAPLADSTEISYSTEEQLMADAAVSPCKNEDRLEAVRELFSRCGASADSVKIAAAGRYKNVVVTVPGIGSGTVIIGAHFDIIGAHFDKVKDGCGAVDNWSGVTLVAHLYKTFRQVQSRRTLIFVAFGGEEEDLNGSRALANAIPKDERNSYCAMLNFDSFGLGRPQIIEEISSPKLTRLVAKIAEESKIPFYAGTLRIGDSDSTSFKRVGIPAVTLHGLSSEWNKILHTNKDTVTVIKSASLYAGYVLAVDVMKQLDSMDCAQLR